MLVMREAQGLTMRYYSLHVWPEMYADYLNNFLTVEKFAEYYGISLRLANDIVDMGRTTDNFSFSKPLTEWKF